MSICHGCQCTVFMAEWKMLFLPLPSFFSVNANLSSISNLLFLSFSRLQHLHSCLERLWPSHLYFLNSSFHSVKHLCSRLPLSLSELLLYSMALVSLNLRVQDGVSILSAINLRKLLQWWHSSWGLLLEVVWSRNMKLKLMQNEKWWPKKTTTFTGAGRSRKSTQNTDFRPCQHYSGDS